MSELKLRPPVAVRVPANCKTGFQDDADFLVAGSEGTEIPHCVRNDETAFGMAEMRSK
jgi:hypothetical protein